MPFVPQSSPGAGQPLTDAFIQTMLDNVDFLLTEVQALQAKGLRQRFTTAVATDVITSTSFVDSSHSQSIVTTGGRLRIYLIGSTVDASVGAIELTGPGTGVLEGDIRAVVGAANLGALRVGADNGANNMQVLNAPPSGFLWEYTPGAGTYTVKIQAKKFTSSDTTQIVLDTVAMVVEEWAV